MPETRWTRFLRFNADERSILRVYTIFWGLCFLLSLTILSGISFFHFLLGHSPTVIEDWVSSYGWYLVISTKLGALIVTLFYVLAVRSLKESFKEFVRKLDHTPHRDVLIIVIVWIVLFFLFSGPTLRDLSTPSILSNLEVYVGTVLFYLIDVFLLSYLEVEKMVIQARRRLIFYLVLVALMGLFLSFPRNMFFQDLSPEHISRFDTWLFPTFAFFWLFILGPFYSHFGPTRDGHSHVILIVLVFLAPLAAFFGLDPICGNSESPYIIKNSLGYWFFIGVTFVSLVHLQRRSFKFKKSIEMQINS